MTSSTKETFLRDYIRRITFSIQNNFSSFLLCLISQNCCNRCQRSLKVVCLVITHTHTHSYLSLSLSSLSLSSLFFTHRQTHRQTYTTLPLIDKQLQRQTDRHTHISLPLLNIEKHWLTLIKIDTSVVGVCPSLIFIFCFPHFQIWWVISIQFITMGSPLSVYCRFFAALNIGGAKELVVLLWLIGDI